ncbi:hypothetical protein [Absidia glauca]|uniref:RING-type E3 ubiquitin transferase n=1 Tax=Absidia glauca TaxID=4829 RepID=A0A168NNQ0_ABSGL|nr:hypothetical protein [Absidia glauca]
MSYTAPTVTEHYEATSLLPSQPPSTPDNYDKKSSNLTLRKRHYGVTPVHVLSRTSSKSNVQQLPDHNYTNKGFYDCNICFDTAICPVLTLCGHLFCWVCLSRWLDQQSINPTCPMCKGECPQNKTIPIYGRGQEEVDPRCDASIPSRPSGQRTESRPTATTAQPTFFHPFTPVVMNSRHSIFLSRTRPGTPADDFLSSFKSTDVVKIP